MTYPTALCTLPTLARALALPPTWLRREAEAGRIPALRAGRRLLFNRVAVETALANRAANEHARKAAHHD